MLRQRTVVTRNGPGESLQCSLIACALAEDENIPAILQQYLSERLDLDLLA